MIHNLGALAERYFADDPNTCLIKLRQFGELLAQLAAAKIGLYEVVDERQINLLNRLRDRGLIAQIQAQAEKQPEKIIQQTIVQAQVAESGVLLDERETRRLIDAQLQRCGWEADSDELTYQNGVRPQKGRNVAIAEYPTTNGRADYALFCGLQIVGVVEAKRQNKDVSEGALNQAKRYSEGFQVLGEVVAGGPWQNYKVPFVFATNGRPFLQQLQHCTPQKFLAILFTSTAIEKL